MNGLFPLDIVGSDPFARFFLARNRKPWLLALLVFLAGAFFMFGVSAFLGVLFPTEGVRNSLADRFNQANYLFIFPAVGFFYLWQVSAILRVYSAVLDLVTSEKRKKMETQVRELHGQYPWWLSGLGVAILTVGLGLLDNFSHFGEFWYTQNIFTIAIMQLARFFALYVIINAIVRHIVVCANMNRIYGNLTLIVSVATTAQSEAFARISGYALSFAVLGAIAGLNLGLQPVLSVVAMPEYVLFVAIYFTLVPAGFFLPFVQARAKMVEAKSAAMLVLDVKYQREYEFLMDTIRSGGPVAEAEEISARLQTIKDAIDITEKAPTWPFEMLSVYRMSVTVFLPFIVALINFIPTLRSVIFGE